MVYSILTKETSFEFQDIIWEVPDAQVSPPLGAVMFISCGNEVKIEKGASLKSNGTLSAASLTLIKHCVEFTFGTKDQKYIPLFGVVSIIVFQLAPPLKLYSIFTSSTDSIDLGVPNKIFFELLFFNKRLLIIFLLEFLIFSFSLVYF